MTDRYNKNIQPEEQDNQPDPVKKKSIEIKKQAAPIPVKQYYTIVMEGNAPVTLTYRILADDEEQALDLIKNATMVAPPKPNLSRMKKSKASVYLSGTSIIKTIRKY